MLDLISEIVSVVIIYVYLSGYPPQTGLLIDVRAVSVKNKHTTAKLVVPKKQTPTRRVGTLPAHASDFLRT
ncbi:hypothetical protein BQ6471_01357 [Vibrio gazogenes]|nr:hypothetical protein BQ6471_01357 [Vibrio gazogenes]